MTSFAQSLRVRRPRGADGESSPPASPERTSAQPSTGRSSRRSSRRSPRGSSEDRARPGLRSVGAIVAWAVVLVTLAVAVARVVVDRAAVAEAKADAGRSAELTARVALAPYLSDDLLAGEPAVVDALADATPRLMELQQVERMKIWTEDSVILWSDDERLIGRRFELTEEELELLATQGAEVEISDLTKDENVFETSADPLLEVYFGTRTDTGTPLLVEMYFSYGLVEELADDYRARFFPLVVLFAMLVALLMIPMVFALIRRDARARRERELLIGRAIDASDAERRRIAAEVHDGAVQDLIGVGFSLAGEAERLDGQSRDRVGELSRSTMSIVRTLRGLLGSIYPVSVPDGGWVAGIADLVDELRNRGVAVSVETPAERPPRLEELVILRTARESLRNVLAHAEATAVSVELTRRGSTWTLEVVDDGRGFDAEDLGAARSDGHLGTSILRDLAGEVGAELAIESSPSAGTHVRLVMDGAR